MFPSRWPLPVRSSVMLLVFASLMLGTEGTAQAAATPVAIWHMNNTGNVMTDASGNGHRGTLRNVTTGKRGFAGTAFGFYSKPSRVKVPSSSLLNPRTDRFTVRVRVKFATRPTASVGDYDLVRKGLAGTAGGHYKVEILQNGYGYCLFKGAAGRVILSRGPNLADSSWHTITCRRYGRTVSLTIDGRTYQKAGPTGRIANTSPVFVGAKDDSGGDQYRGVMDEVTIWRG